MRCHLMISLEKPSRPRLSQKKCWVVRIVFRVPSNSVLVSSHVTAKQIAHLCMHELELVKDSSMCQIARS